MKCHRVLKLALIGHLLASSLLLSLSFIMQGEVLVGPAMLFTLCNLPGSLCAIPLAMLLDATGYEALAAVLGILVSHLTYAFLGRFICPGFRGLWRKPIGRAELGERTF